MTPFPSQGSVRNYMARVRCVCVCACVCARGVVRARVDACVRVCVCAGVKV